MPRITMVRHGQAAAGFSDDLDPGLSELGRAQAEAAADALAAIGPQPMPVPFSSAWNASTGGRDEAL